MSAALQEVDKTYNRAAYCGSSDIAGILGISPWQTRLSVWEKKTQPRIIEDRPGKKKLYSRGHLWEQVVGEMLVAKLEDDGHKVQVLSTNHRYIDPDIPYLVSEIDYEIRLDDIPDIVNVEIKTVHPNAAKEWGEEELSDQVPLHYAAQAAFALGVTRRNCSLVAALFGADYLQTYLITRDDATIAGMRDQAVTFWESYVIPRVTPEPVNIHDVDRLFKKDNETIVYAEGAIVEKLMRYRAAEAEIDARAAERDVLEFEIKRFMKEATILRLPGQDKNAVTWKTQESSRLNVEAFKATYPKLFKEFSKKSTTRPFKVNKFQLGASVDE